MVAFQLSTPVAFIIFNRPEVTARVFAAIRQAKPARLLVIADGPRADRAADDEKCRAARAVIERVDWDCEVLTNYAEQNMGCKRRVSSGLDWVFETVEEAIILEDDCLPHPTFFRFCEALLEKYRDDARIMTVSGSNFQFGRRRTEASYYFSRYPQAWGWATWRRAWRKYDREMRLWPMVRDTGRLRDILENKRGIAYWTRIFEMTYNGNVDTWDYQWILTCWLQSGLAVIPNINLVSNLGFGPGATHTTSSNIELANIPACAMRFPLRHPPVIVRDTDADRFTQRRRFDRATLLTRIKKLGKAFLRKLYVR